MVIGCQNPIVENQIYKREMSCSLLESLSGFLNYTETHYLGSWNRGKSTNLRRAEVDNASLDLLENENQVRQTYQHLVPIENSKNG